MKTKTDHVDALVYGLVRDYPRSSTARLTMMANAADPVLFPTETGPKVLRALHRLWAAKRIQMARDPEQPAHYIRLWTVDNPPSPTTIVP